MLQGPLAGVPLFPYPYHGEFTLPRSQGQVLGRVDALPLELEQWPQLVLFSAYPGQEVQ